MKGQRILIVEEEPIIALDLEGILFDEGAEIIGLAHTVSRALELVDTPGLTAAIVDLRLHNEPVGPIIERLATRGVPFAFYSGQGDLGPLLLGKATPTLPHLSRVARPCS